MKDCNKCTECTCESNTLLFIRINLNDLNEVNNIKQCQVPKLKEIVLNKTKRLFKGNISVDLCFRNNQKSK
jgi:hypothetical protein